MIFDRNARIKVLKCANQSVMMDYMFGLYQLCIGESYEKEQIALIQNEKLTTLNKHGYFIWNPCDTGFCEKKLLSSLEKYVVNEVNNNMEFHNEFMEHSRLNVNLIKRILCDLPFEIDSKQEIMANDWVKLMSLKLWDYTSETIYDKLEKIVTISGFLDEENIIIIPNLKRYLAEKELVELYKCVLYNDTNILLIEHEDDRIISQYESGIYIDSDYEEFIY